MHHAVQPLDLAANHVHVAARVGIDLFHLLPQHFQMHHNRVEGVLHLVGHAGSEPADRRQTARQFNFIFNAMDGLSVAQGEQRADALPPFFDEVERNLDVPPLFVFNFLRPDGRAGFKRI